MHGRRLYYRSHYDGIPVNLSRGDVNLAKESVARFKAVNRTDQLEGRPLLPSPYIPLASVSGRTAALACRWSAEGLVEDNLEKVPMRTFGWV